MSHAKDHPDRIPRLWEIDHRGVACAAAGHPVARRRRGARGACRDRGEPAFRDLEAELLAGLLGGEPCVLATGGGVVLRPGNRDLLRERGRPVVWLTAPADVVRARLAADPTTAARRPGLSGVDPLAEVAAALAARESLYRGCADAVFDTAREPPERVAKAIIAWLERWDAAAASGTAAPESSA